MFWGFLFPRAAFLIEPRQPIPYSHHMSITKEEVDSLLSCAERFDAWARGRIARWDAATSKAAKEASARLEARRKAEEEENERKAKAHWAKQRIVDYTLSRPSWEGVEEFAYEYKAEMTREAVLTLRDKALKVEVVEDKLFPQLAVVDGGKRILITLHTARDWTISAVQEGSKVTVFFRKK